MVAFKTFAEAMEKNHPSDKIAHEITYWIDERMTLDQWIELDDLMSDAFTKVGIDHVVGVAGPIPYDDGDLSE